MGCRWATRPCPWEGVTHPLRRAAKDVQKEKAEATRVCRKCVCGSARLRAAGDLCSVFPTKYMELLFVYMHDACMYILHSSACGTTTTPAPSSPPSASTPSSTPSSWQRTPYIYIYIYIYIGTTLLVMCICVGSRARARTCARTHARSAWGGCVVGDAAACGVAPRLRRGRGGQVAPLRPCEAGRLRRHQASACAIRRSSAQLRPT